MAWAIYQAAQNNRPVLVLAHRKKLLHQLARDLRTLGVGYGINHSGWEPDYSQGVQVCTVQSIRTRLGKIQQGWSMYGWGTRPGLIIHDEAHYAAPSVRLLLDELQFGGLLLGYTATPITSNGYGLGNTYRKLVAGPDIVELTQMGFLVPLDMIVAYPEGVDPDKWRISKSSGDYMAEDVDADLGRGEVLGKVVEAYETYCYDQPTVIVANTVRHSLDILRKFQEAGYPCAHMDGQTPDRVREHILSEFQAGRIKVITNPDLMSEGIDLPHVVNLIHAGATRSLSKWIQRIGRALRPILGPDGQWARNPDGSFVKPRAKVIDMGFCYKKLGHPYDYTRWRLVSTKYDAETIRRDSPKRPHERDCKKCGYVYSGKQCPNCGYEAPAYREENEELIEHKAKYIQIGAGQGRGNGKTEDILLYFAEMLYMAREIPIRNNPEAWAAWRVKDKFGQFPPKGARPTPVKPRWKSRQDAYNALRRKNV
jgi:superfamily II DNA or RNA helicase